VSEDETEREGTYEWDLEGRQRRSEDLHELVVEPRGVKLAGMSDSDKRHSMITD
jgi:hypothetical protein